MNWTRQQMRHKNDSAPAGRVQPADSKPGAVKSSGQAKMPPRKTWLWFVLILLANFLLMRLLLPSPKAPTTVPYTLFREEVKKHNVEAIYTRGENLTGRFKKPITYPRPDEKKKPPSEGRP